MHQLSRSLSPTSVEARLSAIERRLESIIERLDEQPAAPAREAAEPQAATAPKKRAGGKARTSKARGAQSARELLDSLALPEPMERLRAQHQVDGPVVEAGGLRRSLPPLDARVRLRGGAHRGVGLDRDHSRPALRRHASRDAGAGADVRGHEPRRLAEALQHVIDCRDWIVGPVLHVVRGPIGEAAGRVHAGEHGVFDVFAPVTAVASAELVHIRLGTIKAYTSFEWQWSGAGKALSDNAYAVRHADGTAQRTSRFRLPLRDN